MSNEDPQPPNRLTVGTIFKGWRTIAFSTSLSLLTAITYFFITPEIYLAESLLAPSQSKDLPVLGGNIGGLAALAGVSLGGGETAEALATLKSRELARQLIEAEQLIKVLLRNEWDDEHQRWRSGSENDQPDVRDAIEVFHEDILSISENPQTGLISVGIRWQHSREAAEWNEKLVRRANEILRNRALSEAEANLSYLRSQLSQTTPVALQQAIGALIEQELQRLMLAKGNKDFAFRIVDPPMLPKKPHWPKLPVLTVAALILGVAIGIAIVVVSQLKRDNHPAPSN